jgi:hypothetical protein
VRGPERALAQDKPKREKPIGPRRAPPETDTARDRADEAAAAAKERRSADIFRRIHEHPVSSDAGRNARIESALDETVNFEIEPQPLGEAIDLLATRFQIPILIDKKAFNGMNIGATEVTLNVPGITLRETLDSILSIPDGPVSFQIRRGALVVSTLEQINQDQQVVVYDCRDLAHVGTLDHFAIEKQEGGSGASGAAWVLGGGGPGMFQAVLEAAQPDTAAQGLPQKGAAAAPNPPQPPANGSAPAPAIAAPAPAVAPVPAAPPAPPAVPAQAPRTENARRLPLIQTIIAATGDSWDEGSTTITEFGGLLVVRQSPLVHDKIKTLLADIRRMRADGAFASFAKDDEAEAKRRADAEAKASGHVAK